MPNNLKQVYIVHCQIKTENVQFKIINSAISLEIYKF